MSLFSLRSPVVVRAHAPRVTGGVAVRTGVHLLGGASRFDSGAPTNHQTQQAQGVVVSFTRGQRVRIKARRQPGIILHHHPTLPAWVVQFGVKAPVNIFESELRAVR